jgi:hypothetical protein
MQAGTTVNVMRAPRTSILPEADTVDDVESNNAIDVKANQLQSGGVCDAGMHEIAQSRNLGDPECSLIGRNMRRKIAYINGVQEVRLVHSTGEAE